MHEVVYCKECSQYVGYISNWDLEANCCEKCSKKKS